jgi:hypothetical protein
MPKTPAWDKAIRGSESVGAIPTLEPGGLVVEFHIPRKPISVNSLYQILYTQRRVRLHPDAREFKDFFKRHVPLFHAEQTTKLAVDLAIHHDWFYKNGGFRKLDVQNMEKIIIDSIFEMVDPDDCQVWMGRWEKIQSTEVEGITVKVFAIE